MHQETTHPPFTKWQRLASQGLGLSWGGGEILYPPLDGAVHWTPKPSCYCPWVALPCGLTGHDPASPTLAVILHQHSKPVASTDSRGQRLQNPAVLLSPCFSLPCKHPHTHTQHRDTNSCTHTHTLTYTHPSPLSSKRLKPQRYRVGQCGSTMHIPEGPPSQLWSSWNVEAQTRKAAVCTGESRKASQRRWHLDCGVQIRRKSQCDLEHGLREGEWQEKQLEY